MSNAPGFSDLLCAAVPGLKEKQLEICKKYPQYIPIVGMGVKLAVDGCQRQFKMERWNCPTSNQSDSLFGRLLEEGMSGTPWGGLLFHLFALKPGFPLHDKCHDHDTKTKRL